MLLSTAHYGLVCTLSPSVSLHTPSAFHFHLTLSTQHTLHSSSPDTSTVSLHLPAPHCSPLPAAYTLWQQHYLLTTPGYSTHPGNTSMGILVNHCIRSAPTSIVLRFPVRSSHAFGTPKALGKVTTHYVYCVAHLHGAPTAPFELDPEVHYDALEPPTPAQPCVVPSPWVDQPPASRSHSALN